MADKKRKDNALELKWSQPRVMYSETNPYKDPGIDFSGDPGLTDKSQAAECDVNNILKKYQQTGVLPGVDVQSLYQDVSDAPSYHEACNIVLQAQAQFDALDAYTRQRFANDPAQFLEFANSPENVDEMLKLGLAQIRPKNATETIVEAIQGSKTPSPAS